MFIFLKLRLLFKGGVLLEKIRNLIFIGGILLICIFMILPSVSSNILIYTDDVEIFIGAGFRGKNIGYGLHYKVINHRLEPINCTYSIEYFSLSDVFLRETTGEPFIIEPGNSTNCIMFIFYFKNPLGVICKFNFTLNADSYSLSRNGIKIGQLFITN